MFFPIDSWLFSAQVFVVFYYNRRNRKVDVAFIVCLDGAIHIDCVV